MTAERSLNPVKYIFIIFHLISCRLLRFGFSLWSGCDASCVMLEEKKHQYCRVACEIMLGCESLA